MTLIVIFALLSMTLTGITYYFSGMWQQWYWFWTIPLLLYAYFLTCFATWIIWLFVMGLFVKADQDYIYKPNRIAQGIVRRTCRVTLLLLNVRTHVTGRGKIPAHTPVMLINNHLSVFDEIAIAAFFPTNMVFITKPGNFDLPIAGPWMRYAGYLPIKQGDMANGTEVIRRASEYIAKKKITVCVAPEGTRNKEFPNPILLPFHAGTFRLAQDTGAPIVVLAIQNTNCIFKRFPRHRTHIYLDVVGVVEKEEYQSMSTREIADRCRDLIMRRFEKKDARFYHIKPKAPKEEEAPKE